MSGFTGAGAGGIQQITGSGGIAITNPFGPITDINGAGIAVPCASYVVAGRMEVATLPESFAGTYLGGSGCPLALSPRNQSFREEIASGAMFTPFSSPISLVAGFGAYALDIQPNRSNIANLASGAGANCIGQDNRATAANASCLGQTNIATGLRANCWGFTNRGYGNNSVAAGYRNEAGTAALHDNLAFGRSNFARDQSSVAIGIMNNVNVPANLNDTTGVIINDPQAILNNGKNSSALGVANRATGLRATGVGFKNLASGIGATAIGDRGIARIENTVNVAGPIIIRKDDGEPIADAFRVFAGAEVLVLTDEIDLTAVADQTITLPAGCHFWWNECGLILTELTGLITSQPTVRFGITGTPAKYVAAVLTTLLTATLKRERFQVLLADDGETSLVAGVTVGAVVGTSMAGRFFFKGVLVEDE